MVDCTPLISISVILSNYAIKRLTVVAELVDQAEILVHLLVKILQKELHFW
jgi:hypothetical protein